MANAARQTLEEPNMRTWARELNVPQPLTAHTRQSDFDAAFIADHAAMLHALVLSHKHSQSVTGPKMRAQNKPSRSGLKVR